MFGSLELRHLRYFLAACEHGSFRKAGAALGIRESTISRAIRDLEDSLGASLFQRYAGGVRLAFAGKKFLYRAHNVLQEISDGAKDVVAIGRCEGRGQRFESSRVRHYPSEEWLVISPALALWASVTRCSMCKK